MTVARKILLTGSTGYVGSLIQAGLGEHWDLTGVSRHSTENPRQFRCDLVDRQQIYQLRENVEPDVIVHAAGDKNLVRCEAAPKAAYLSNVQTTLNLIEAFPRSRIIYISSDYVFSGDRGGYREDDPLSPLTVYGRTKACAELAGLMLSPQFYILRLSALYDHNATFIRFLRDRLISGEPVDCYSDAYYSPTFFGDFLAVLQRVVENSDLNRRIYHSCGHRTSRYYFAKLFARASGFDESLVLQASRAENNVPYLFADISLENTLTREALEISMGGHEGSLSAMVAL